MSLENYRTAKPIYIVTTMVFDEALGRTTSERTWGWHPTEDDAKDAVINNDAGIFECDYNLAVIEEVFCGTLADGGSSRSCWFKAFRDDYKVVLVESCEQPVGLEGLFSMG